MKRRFPILVALLMLVVSGATVRADAPVPPPDVPKEGGALDGKSFSGERVRTGEKIGDPDTLVFRDGTFRSTASERYGFQEVAYRAMKLGEVITFTAIARSETFGKMTWQGRVRGNTLEANIIWVKPGDERETSQIKASLDPK